MFSAKSIFTALGVTSGVAFFASSYWSKLKKPLIDRTKTYYTLVTYTDKVTQFPDIPGTYVKDSPIAYHFTPKEKITTQRHSGRTYLLEIKVPKNAQVIKMRPRGSIVTPDSDPTREAYDYKSNSITVLKEYDMLDPETVEKFNLPLDSSYLMSAIGQKRGDSIKYAMDKNTPISNNILRKAASESTLDLFKLFTADKIKGCCGELQRWVPGYDTFVDASIHNGDLSILKYLCEELELYPRLESCERSAKRTPEAWKYLDESGVYQKTKDEWAKKHKIPIMYLNVISAINTDKADVLKRYSKEEIFKAAEHFTVEYPQIPKIQDYNFQNVVMGKCPTNIDMIAYLCEIEMYPSQWLCERCLPLQKDVWDYLYSNGIYDKVRAAEKESSQ